MVAVNKSKDLSAVGILSLKPGILMVLPYKKTCSSILYFMSNKHFPAVSILHIPTYYLLHRDINILYNMLMGSSVSQNTFCHFI